jgi:hypothetical protein
MLPKTPVYRGFLVSGKRTSDLLETRQNPDGMMRISGFGQNIFAFLRMGAGVVPFSCRVPNRRQPLENQGFRPLIADSGKKMERNGQISSLSRVHNVFTS